MSSIRWCRRLPSFNIYSVIEATPLLTYPFWGSSIPALVVLSLRLINRTEGSFSLFPPVPLRVFFLAPLILWSSAATVDRRLCSDPGRYITLNAPEYCGAFPLPHQLRQVLCFFHHISVLGFRRYLQFFQSSSVLFFHVLPLIDGHFVLDASLAVAYLPWSSQILMRKELI